MDVAVCDGEFSGESGDGDVFSDADDAGDSPSLSV